MNNKHIILICSILFAPFALAQKYSVPSINPVVVIGNTGSESAWELEELKRATSFTENERRSLSVANSIQNKRLDAYESDDGSVTYLFGQAMAVVVCTPMRLCNISLEQGEVVNDVHIGDSARWQVAPSVSGEAPYEVVHAVVKPIEVGIETSLMITTDRRVYHMTLKSSESDYMPSVKFRYPNSQKGEWDDLMQAQSEMVATQEALRADEEAARQQQNAAPKGTPRLGISVDDLHFEYRIKGDNYVWRPLRVYDDGIRTFIQLPDEALNGELPVLLAENKTDDIVNYRIKDNRFIVDGVSPRLILIKGVGRSQDRLTIERMK